MAAVAILFGLDPIRELARHPADAVYALAGYERALERQAEHDRWLVESIANRTGYVTADGITSWLGRAFKAMTSKS